MIHIILILLKIIGIVLLVIIGLLVLLLCLALFVPVRYRIEVGRREDEGSPPVNIKAQITWLLHLINVKILYPAEAIVRVRLLFITLLRLPKKEESTEKQRAKKEKKKNKAKAEKNEKEKEAETKDKRKGPETETESKRKEPETESTDRGLMTKQERTGETGKKQTESLSAKEDKKELPYVTLKREKENKEKEEKEEKEKEKEKIPLRDKIKAFINTIKKIILKIKDLFQNIQYTIQNICDKIESVSHNIQYYREIVECDAFKQSFSLCKGELGYLFRKLKPDKFSADFTIGMDDPAATGEILAIYGMLYPLLGMHVTVAGDFEQKRIEGDLYLRGHMRVFTFLKILFKIYFNKDVKKLMKMLKKEA